VECETRNEQQWAMHQSRGKRVICPRNKGGTMEELQQTLITEINNQLKSKEKDVALLDVLNRLLGTVDNCLISKG